MFVLPVITSAVVSALIYAAFENNFGVVIIALIWFITLIRIGVKEETELHMRISYLESELNKFKESENNG